MELRIYDKPINLISKYIQPYNLQDLTKFNENFKIIKTIIPNGLSPTVIHVAEEINSNKMVAMKELRKEKFKQNFNTEMAKNELIIHNSLSKLSNNIVTVYDYYEDEKSFYLLMEFCEEPNYFEEILENVIIFLYFSPKCLFFIYLYFFQFTFFIFYITFNNFSQLLIIFNKFFYNF